MKKVFSAALLLIPGLVFAQADQFSIKGKVGSLNSPARAYILYSANDQTTLDSVTLQNGNFEFKGTIQAPAGATITISHNGKPFNELHKRDELNIYLEAKPMVLTPADSIANATIPNSQINDDDKKLQAALKPSSQKYSQLYKEYRATSPDSQKSATFQKRMQEREDAIEQEKNVVELDFIKNNPQSMISLFTLEEYAGPVPDGEKIAPYFNSLSAEVKDSPRGKKYNIYISVIMRTAVGKPAPEFSQPDTAGKQIALSSYRGKYVLLDFWASWCHPCRAENPVVVAAFNKYHPKGLEILSVSLDDNRASWVKAILQDKLPWAQVSDLKYWKSEVSELYGVRAIPQNFLIAPDGKIVAKNLRGNELETKLEEVFNKMQ